MMKHFYLLFFLAFAVMAGTASGQGFSFTPPDNFVADTSDAGVVSWVNKSAGSVIQISVTAGSSYEAFSKSFSEEQLTSQNLIIKEKRTFKGCDNGKLLPESMLFVCSYMTVSEDITKSVEFTRIVYFSGDHSKVIMAVATIPTMAETVMLEPVIQSFEKKLIISQ